MANPKPLTHPADGLYYLNIHLLAKRLACESQRARWYRRYRNRNTPVTLEVVSEMHTSWQRCVHWAAATMFHNGLVSAEHYEKFCDEYRTAYFKANVDGECRALMNLLLNRARREADIRKAAA